ncbi:Neutral endopeptidase [Candidatus Providencia siddallii]|uniref:Neutral endopeptidase n=1 Tax=Candidatus Providencia siddallii TaxID=1715285 RepID=A0A0M6WAD3_9GAMM|nr:Neutral endopeptidase [Candidatus Providencia siddallii]
MHSNILAICVGISTMSYLTPQLLAKEISYGNQKIVLSDSINPGNDFYHYVNNDWIKNTQIPDGNARYNSFIELYLNSEKQIQSIIDQLQNTPENELNQNQRNIRNLYLSYLNESYIEKIGISPILCDLKAIKEAKNHNEISHLMMLPNYNSLINYWVDPDAKNSKIYVLYISQGNLGLPNRDFYLKNSKEIKEVRKNYFDYISLILKNAGEKNVNNKAKKIINLEKSIAKIHWSPEDRRNTIKNYHSMSLEEVKKFTNGFDLSNFIKKNNLTDKSLKKIIVETDDAVAETIKIFINTPISTIKDYLIFRYLNKYASFLNKNFSDAHFNFFSNKLNGIKNKRTRKEYAIQMVNSLQGEPLGEIYVKKYFDKESKEKIQDLVNRIRNTFNLRLKNNNWMDFSTRKEALKKLERFTIKIGYPDKWNDFSNINFTQKELISNYKQILNWNHKNMLSKIGQPIRNWEWEMTPQTVNAYFNPVQNEIVLPAAILQAPFFDKNVDYAYNYGSIGAVIAHEMGHGFDDQGSLYDSTGELRDWWQNSAKVHFKEKTNKLIKQYNAFKINGQKINGYLTLGENIGDLGGLTIVLDAYKQFIKDNYLTCEAPIIDNTTGIQRLFISWARTWRELSNEESQRNRIMTDPHSPYKFRTNGVVRNIDDWYTAFGINKNNELFLEPNQRVYIW